MQCQWQVFSSPDEMPKVSNDFWTNTAEVAACTWKGTISPSRSILYFNFVCREPVGVFLFFNSMQQRSAILHTCGKVLLQPHWLFLLHGSYLPRNTTVEGQISFDKRIQFLEVFYRMKTLHCSSSSPLLLRLKWCCTEQHHKISLVLTFFLVAKFVGQERRAVHQRSRKKKVIQNWYI